MDAQAGDSARYREASSMRHTPPPQPVVDALVGRVIAFRYKICARLGGGGFWATYRAWDLPSGRYVVLRIQASPSPDQEAFRDRFAGIMQDLQRLEHSHVIPIVDEGILESRPFAVMPYVAGGSLDLRRPRREDRLHPMSVASLQSWLPGVASALDHAHRHGIVHHNIKPTKIIFDGDERASIADIGWAHITHDLTEACGGPPASGATNGAPHPVDQRLPQRECFSPAGDQFLLGMMLLEILTAGRNPYGESRPGMTRAGFPPSPQRLLAIRPDLSKATAESLHRALAESPERRFPDCATFAAAMLSGVRPPPASRRRRLMCPHCRGLILCGERLGGKISSCPQCSTRLWIPPDMGFLVVAAERETEGTAVGNSGTDVVASGLSRSWEASAGESGRVINPGPGGSFRRWARIAALGVAILTTILGLGLGFSLNRVVEEKTLHSGQRDDVAPSGTDEGEALAFPQGIQVPDESSTTHAIGDQVASDGVVAEVHADPPAPRATPGTDLLPPAGGTAIDQPVPGNGKSTPPSDSLTDAAAEGQMEPSPPDTPSEEAPAAPSPPQGLSIDEALVTARLDVLMDNLRAAVETIEKSEAAHARLTPDYDRDKKAWQDVTGVIANFEARANELARNEEQARAQNNIVLADQLRQQRFAALQQAAALRPEQAQHLQAVMNEEKDLRRLRDEIASQYSEIALAFPAWVKATSPLDRDRIPSPTAQDVDDICDTAARLMGDSWTHLESSVIRLHLMAATADVTHLEQETSRLIDLIERADGVLTSRGASEDYRRRTLHFPRLHVAYVAFRVLTLSVKPSKKIDEWLRRQHVNLYSVPAGRAVQGLHAVAQRRFPTAMKHFKEFLKNKDHFISYDDGRLVEDPRLGVIVLHAGGKSTTAIDEVFGLTLQAEVAWLLAAAPPPIGNTDRAQALLDELMPQVQSTGNRVPWPALRADAAIRAAQQQWDDAMSLLDDAESRAPLALAEDIEKQRAAYRDRRQYYLPRSR